MVTKVALKRKCSVVMARYACLSLSMSDSHKLRRKKKRKVVNILCPGYEPYEDDYDSSDPYWVQDDEDCHNGEGDVECE